MRHISNQDGFVLVAGLILMTVLATIALGSFAVSNTEVQVSANYRSSVQAVTLAEGALARVLSWFNNPATFTDTTVGTYHGLITTGEKGPTFFTKRRTGGKFFSTGRLSQFYDVNNDGGIGDTSSTNPALEYKSSNDTQKTFLDTTFNVVSGAGNITNIKIFGSANPEEVALVQVTAQSTGGGTATIEAVLGPNPGSNIANGLEVGGAAAMSGNARGKVHWSKALIVSDADFGNPGPDSPPQLTCATTNPGAHPDNKTYGSGGGKREDDPWLEIRVGGIVSTSGGPAWPGGCSKGPFPDGYNHNTAPSLATKCDSPKHKNLLPGLNNDPDLANNVVISKISYDDAKVVAKKSVFYKGNTPYPSYYYTKPGEANRVYDAAGTPHDPFKDLIDGITKGMIFVDTTDQKIPNAAGTNLLDDLRINSNISFKGSMILAAKLAISGMGSTTNIDVKSPPWNNTAPDCTEYPSTSCSVGASSPMCATAAEDRKPVSALPVHLQGLIYAFGAIDIAGNLQIFGAMITEQGFTGNGTWEIWFDYDLRNGNPNGPAVFIRSWREVGST